MILDAYSKTFKKEMFLFHSKTQTEQFAEISVKKLTKNQILLDQGQSCSKLPFVLSGCLRVFKISESGKEITLYRIQKGESCILSSSCHDSELVFPARVIAEEDTEAIFISLKDAARLIDENKVFRNFVFSQYSKKMASIMELIEEITFKHIDERLKDFLLTSKDENKAVLLTHQEIAFHLGTSREVVSRLLKEFEATGFLALKRGKIVLM